MKALNYLKRLRAACSESFKLDNRTLCGLVRLDDITELDAAIAELEDEPDYDAFLTEAIEEVPKV